MILIDTRSGDYPPPHFDYDHILKMAGVICSSGLAALGRPALGIGATSIVAMLSRRVIVARSRVMPLTSKPFGVRLLSSLDVTRMCSRNVMTGCEVKLPAHRATPWTCQSQCTRPFSKTARALSSSSESSKNAVITGASSKAANDLCYATPDARLCATEPRSPLAVTHPRFHTNDSAPEIAGEAENAVTPEYTRNTSVSSSQQGFTKVDCQNQPELESPGTFKGVDLLEPMAMLLVLAFV
jgi:hypothetical protein